MNPLLIEDVVRRALKEDLGWGDITSRAIVPSETRARASIICRSEGVVAGLAVAALCFQILDPEVNFQCSVNDGAEVKQNTVLATVEGMASAMLAAERVALNFLQHLSGIATATSSLVKAAAPFGVKITDTRKTTPGLRVLEKYAVRVGGGINHRFGLDDAVLIKDNHIRLASGIKPAVESVRRSVGHMVKVEVEAETLDQVREALEAGADVILLDNMDVPTMQQAVALVSGRAILEASGRITPQNVAQIAATGVNIISSGWITHSAPALDISMEMEEMYR